MPRSKDIGAGDQPNTSGVPVIRLRDYLIVALQGSIDDLQAIRLQEEILGRIKGGNITGLVLDISVVPVMDSYIARMLNHIARSASLMGVRSVIVGMRPAIAITLVTMGLAFENMETAMNLDSAIALLETPVQEQEGGSDD